jgi:uncharacterized protein (DUF608 family)
MAQSDPPCCGGGACGDSPDWGPDRRAFLKSTAVAAFGSLARAQGPAAQGPGAQGSDHRVPADKQLSPQWLASLAERAPRPWRGDELRTIAMPCGGVAAGQLYLDGEGRLAGWWIANDACHTSSGERHSIDTPGGARGVGYATFAPARPVAHGALLAVREGPAPARLLPLDRATFPELEFLGEYPLATIDYRGAKDLPLRVRLEAGAPFVPCSARDSALPATVLRYTVTNTGDRPLAVTLASFLQNPVLCSLRGTQEVELRNLVVRTDALTAVTMEAAAAAADDEPVTLFDFERGYEGWQVQSGDAFGDAPAAGTLPDQQEVTGFHGKALVNTYRGGDAATGVLVSPEFALEKPWLAFRIGGGRDPERLTLALEVQEEGKWRRVRSATGDDRELLTTKLWRVDDLHGRTARLVIRDASRRPWGHINVDWIRACANPPADVAFTQGDPAAGTVVLALLDPAGVATADLGPVPAAPAAPTAIDALLPGATAPLRLVARGSLEQPPRAGVAATVQLPPGGEHTFAFAVTWHFPNRRQRDDAWVGAGDPCGADGPRVGNRYATWFPHALAVAQHLAEHGDALLAATRSFRDALYRDTTLPHWFVQRIGAPLSTLATATLQWREDGTVWAWEGVGCCPGTCGHVWNYAQGMAWLFPELERSVRERQDFARGRGLKSSGAIGFRGTADADWAADAQAGYVLKTYREHRLSGDREFLPRVWPAVRSAVGFLLAQDGDPPDGLLEGKQPNTYDIDFVGANTMVGSLWLAALRAAAAMARAMDDAAFAERCEQLAARGAELTMQRLWNGEYFVQELPAAQRDAKWQYGDGCLADQLLGQWFADQLELGHLYPHDAVRTALQSIWRCNWAPDVGPQMAAHKPERDFAVVGEPGLFVCTWPKSAHRGAQSVRYRDEVWTGIEYQFAAHLLREGFVTEGLSVVRGVHERYAPGKHNPYNEIECGDHYARALASWSCLLGVAGFAYDIAANTLSFAPRMSPDDFGCAFTAGTAFGTIAQRRASGDAGAVVVEQWLTVRHGRMQAPAWRLEAPAGMRAVAAVRHLPGSAERERTNPEARQPSATAPQAALPFAQRDGRVEVQPPAGLALDVASPHYGVRVDFAAAK